MKLFLLHRRFLLILMAMVFMGAASAWGSQDGRSEKPQAVALPARQLRMALYGRVAAPGFALKDLSGKEVRLSDFQGKVVLVNFWTTW